MFGRSRTITFQEVAIHAQKNGTCDVCGRLCSRKQKFYQTINPFNKKNPYGPPKTREEIYEELKEQSSKWKCEPVRHAKCEKSATAK